MPAMTTTTTPDRLPFTGDDEADRLLAEDPFALLIGFALDQQVSVQKAFSGPLELRRRIGNLDPRRIAASDPAELEEAFRRRPALHRFPGAMAKRVQALAAHVDERYGGAATRIWTEASDGRDLERRLKALPSFGDMKVRSMLAILQRRFGVVLPGMDGVVPTYPTLGDVDSPEALERYQAQKRAYKAELRARGEEFTPGRR
jgi:uncharacterized HhH-GPD family protein